MKILLEGVKKTMRDATRRTEVLRDVSVVLRPGRSLGVLGLRGSGKTTLIRTICGSARPDAGRIERRCRVSLPIGSMAYLNRIMSGREMIVFLSRLHRLDDRPIIKFVREFSGLGAALDTPMGEWSRGERSSYLMSVSWGFPAGFYAADEIMIGGTGRFRERCASLLNARRRTEGLVFTTTAPRFVQMYADDAAVLHDGRLESYPSVGEAIRRYRQLRLEANLQEEEAPRAEMEDAPSAFPDGD